MHGLLGDDFAFIFSSSNIFFDFLGPFNTNYSKDLVQVFEKPPELLQQ